MSDQTIGFIGIGNMGWPMAANLVRGGYKLVVCDANHERAEQFSTEHGDMAQAATLEQMGALTSVVITMLPTGHTVRRVMLEEKGALAEALPAGALLIDMSSSDPIGTRELGKELSDREIQFVDAPVSGGVPGATKATLAIMMGSDNDTALERAKPILKLLGNRLFETGPLGSGHAMKSLNNFVAGSGFAAICEALLIGTRFGLDPAVMVDILNASTGRSFTTESTIGPEVVNRAFGSGFALALLAKDVKIAADLAGGLGLEMPFSRLTSEQFQAASESLGPGRDFTETFLYWETKAANDS